MLFENREDLKLVVASNVRFFRRSLFITQLEFARLLGIHPLTYNGYEIGKNAFPLYVLVSICNLYHLSLDNFVDPMFPLKYSSPAGAADQRR